MGAASSFAAGSFTTDLALGVLGADFGERGNVPAELLKLQTRSARIPAPRIVVLRPSRERRGK